MITGSTTRPGTADWLLNVAARFLQRTAFRVRVQVPREAGVVASARALAKRTGIGILVEIDEATITLRFEDRPEDGLGCEVAQQAAAVAQ